MLSRSADADGPPATSRAVTWLRVVKLTLSIILLAIGVIEALRGFGLV